MNESQHNSEQQLINQYLAGQEKALQTLHNYVTQLIEKGLQAMEARGSYFRNREDVIQEIIATIMVKDRGAVLRNFKGDSRLSTYLWSVIRFKLIDKLRQEMILRERQEPLPEHLVDDSDVSTELLDLIDRFLKRCSQRDAFILRLRWLEEMDYDAICQEAAQQKRQVDKTYIGNLLFRKRKELLSFLKKEGYPIDIQM